MAESLSGRFHGFTGIWDELWVVARRTQRLKELEGEVSIPLRIFDGDLQRDYIYERIERELSRHTPDIRMLVNGAGYGKVGDMAGTAWQEKEDRWEEKVQAERREQLGQIDINCRALTRMIQICLPYQGKGSRILNIASRRHSRLSLDLPSMRPPRLMSTGFLWLLEKN